MAYQILEPIGISHLDFGTSGMYITLASFNPILEDIECWMEYENPTGIERQTFDVPILFNEDHEFDMNLAMWCYETSLKLPLKRIPSRKLGQWNHNLPNKQYYSFCRYMRTGKEKSQGVFKLERPMYYYFKKCQELFG